MIRGSFISWLYGGWNETLPGTVAERVSGKYVEKCRSNLIENSFRRLPGLLWRSHAHANWNKHLWLIIHWSWSLGWLLDISVHGFAKTVNHESAGSVNVGACLSWQTGKSWCWSLRRWDDICPSSARDAWFNVVGSWLDIQSYKEIVGASWLFESVKGAMNSASWAASAIQWGKLS